MKEISTPVVFGVTMLFAVIVLGVLILSTNNNVYANFELPLQVEEYFDYSCSHCQDFNATSKQAAERFGEDIEITYRYFQIFPDSRDAAIAAEAAREQGKYLEYHHGIFDAIESEGVSTGDVDLVALAQELELDIDKFNADREKPDIAARVDANTELGVAAGVQGTPAVFIDDVQVRLERDSNGTFQPFLDKLQEIIDNVKASE